MIPLHSFRHQNLALFGLGSSGLSTALAIQAGGGQALAWDDQPSTREHAERRGIPVEDLRHLDWSEISALVLSPGVPLLHPKPHWAAACAQAAGVPIMGDIELFCRERAASAPEAPFVAITGTNGKSTTTALITHLLSYAGHTVQMGGNIGVPVLALDPPSQSLTHVIECSSFQIDLAPSLAPSIGIHLNLTPDHLDRHATMEEYAAVKERLVASADTAIIGVDDAWGTAMASRREARNKPTLRLSMQAPVSNGVFLKEEKLVLAHEGAQAPLVSLQGLDRLLGLHNAQNTAAACAAAWLLGVETSTLQDGLRTFPGLAHRMEIVGREDNILYVNDSKATNAEAAEKALLSFPSIFWILGGHPKEGGIERLVPLFDRIEKAYLIGEASDAFAATLDGHAPFERSGTLDKAVEAALRDAKASKAPEPVVLLSPACASYDQFKNFEERGDTFKALVRNVINPVER